GPEQQVLLDDVLDDLLLVPDVIARRHHVGAVVEDVAGDRRRHAEARGGILDVDDREIGLVLLLEARQQRGDGTAPGLAEHVTHAEDREWSSHHFATSTARVSRMTITLMWPGYCISASIRLLMSFASWCASRSEICSALVMMRSSRPAWIA